MLVVLIVGTSRRLLAALIALTQTDLKRVSPTRRSASSATCSWPWAPGPGWPACSTCLTHAFFKALLFLGSGSRDARAWRASRTCARSAACASRCPSPTGRSSIGAWPWPACPASAGFWSKDAILAADFVDGILRRLGGRHRRRLPDRLLHVPADVPHLLGREPGLDEVKAHIHESPATMTVPLIILASRRRSSGLVVGGRPKRLESTVSSSRSSTTSKAERFHWAGSGGGAHAGLAVVGWSALSWPTSCTSARPTPKRAGERVRGLQGVVHKFYMDEFYEKVVIRPTIGVRRLAGHVLRRQGRSTAPSTGSPGSGAALGAVFAAADRPCAGLRSRRVRRSGRAGRHRLDLGGVMGWTRRSASRSCRDHVPAVVGVYCCCSARGGRSLQGRLADRHAASLALSLVMLFRFDTGATGMQFVERCVWVERFNIRYGSASTGSRRCSIFLTTPARRDRHRRQLELRQGSRARLLRARCLLLAAGMVGVFCATDIFLFYVFWEVMLVPMYFLIGIWGGPRQDVRGHQVLPVHPGRQPAHAGRGRRDVSSMHAMTLGFYTFDITDTRCAVRTPTNPVLGLRRLLRGFAIKVPMWPFHTWLPDAHVEAPTAGSVILAGVLLKMGGYGMLRFCLPLFPDAAVDFVPLVVGLSVVAILYGALVSLRRRTSRSSSPTRASATWGS